MSTPDTARRVDLTDSLRADLGFLHRTSEQVVAVYENVLVFEPVFPGAETRQATPTATVEVVIARRGGGVRAVRLVGATLADALDPAPVTARAAAGRVA